MRMCPVPCACIYLTVSVSVGYECLLGGNGEQRASWRCAACGKRQWRLGGYVGPRGGVGREMRRDLTFGGHGRGEVQWNLFLDFR